MSTAEKSAVRVFTDPREAFLASAAYSAEQEFIQQSIERYKQSDRYKEYLKRDPAEREQRLQKLREEGRIKDRLVAVSERADYIAEQEFKQRHREMFMKSDRYQEYLKRQQFEQNNETTEPQS